MLTTLILSGISAAFAECHIFNLDSISQKGRFAKFCVDTYRWGDRFFNGYDTTFVSGTGYKFNVKITSDSWTEGYRLMMDDESLYMRADPSTSIGLHLTYLAVTLGYDVNVSKLLGSIDRTRKRVRFGFNCSLLSFELYRTSNDASATIKNYHHATSISQTDIPFDGIDNTTFGIDAYYFFNHKRYSEAAAFSFSRIQKQSQGSFHAGLSFYHQNARFDFASLINHDNEYMHIGYPLTNYIADTKNVGLRLGYGYNWVFAHKWLMSISESPVIGLRYGYVNSANAKYSVSLYNHFKLSVVWNSGRWFVGVIGKLDNSIISGDNVMYINGVGSLEAAVGMRFNIW